ncbi:hypothetical protein CLCAR_2038 [Clostridium carboxidivorans P7]|nr:hypothetical protein CLCAR_2038 [Clostridium carboxidivorans P7]
MASLFLSTNRVTEMLFNFDISEEKSTSLASSSSLSTNTFKMCQ